MVIIVFDYVQCGILFFFFNLIITFHNNNNKCIFNDILKSIFNKFFINSFMSDYYLPEQINIMSGDTCKPPNQTQNYINNIQLISHNITQ